MRPIPSTGAGAPTAGQRRRRPDADTAAPSRRPMTTIRQRVRAKRAGFRVPRCGHQPIVAAKEHMSGRGHDGTRRVFNKRGACLRVPPEDVETRLCVGGVDGEYDVARRGHDGRVLVPQVRRRTFAQGCEWRRRPAVSRYLEEVLERAEDDEVVVAPHPEGKTSVLHLFGETHRRRAVERHLLQLAADCEKRQRAPVW